jgi:hypothetical protein
MYASATAHDIAEAVVEAARGGANLRSANLGGANLVGADLRGAKGTNPLRLSPLHGLRDQPGKIRLYKLVTASGVGPFRGGIVYEIGEAYEVENADTDAGNDCGAGINVATLDWCLRRWLKGRRVLVVEFEARDIAAIPTASDGKLRLHRCTVVGEKTLEELGIAQEHSDRDAWQAEQDAKEKTAP